MEQAAGANITVIEHIFYRLYQLISGNSTIELGTLPFWNGLLVFLAIITIFLAIVFAYSYIRLSEIRGQEEAYLKTVKIAEPKVSSISRFQKIEQLAYSANENDWRQAIIDADTLLDELVIRMGYEGDNLGERLKKVEPSDFNTLQSAWEAHKVRNRIAHEGSAFQLTQHDARRTIALYREVFQEFNFL